MKEAISKRGTVLYLTGNKAAANAARDLPRGQLIMADETAATASSPFNPLELASEITIAWLNNPNNRVTPEDVPTFLRNMHATINELVTGPAVEEAPSGQAHTPAVSPRSSIKPDFLISLIDGKPYKTLKRHLSRHGLTPAEYRQRYSLRADYPMTAPNYSEMRRETARRIGLGNKSRNNEPSGSEVGDGAPAVEAAAPAARKARALKAGASADASISQTSASKESRTRKSAGKGGPPSTARGERSERPARKAKAETTS
jgi:predicted transcriptional regulator